ncbi:MAG: hypothetical protein L6R38_005744, partial [Xanthoria sp. 2 TBL-2021]
MACGFRTSFLTTLLILCVSSALPLVLDIPPQIIANSTSRTNLRVKGPATPPGFKLRLLMSSSEPLNPNHLYLCAIEAMYHLAQEEWEDTVRTGHSAIVKGLQISYYDLLDRPIDMQYRHVILAVLVVVDTMDRKDEFFRAVVKLQQDKEVFGTVRIGRRSNGDVNGNGNDAKMGIEGGGDGGGKNITDHAPAPAPATARRDDSNPNSTAPTNTRLTSPKTLIDPSDPSLTITYERFGATLDCKILFGAALDALATLAQDDDGDTIDMFTGENWSQK